MNLLNFLFVLLFIFGLIYLVMGLVAYSHTLRDDRSDKMLAVSPWWAIYSSNYDEFGKKLSKHGKRILFIEVIGFVVWMILK